MDWAEDYLSQCLSGIPKSKYRARLRGELAEHLALLVSDLENVGYVPEEARHKALEQMGDADALNEGYRAEWMRQPERLRWDLSRELYGCLLAGLSVVVVFPLFGLLWNKWDTPLRHPPTWVFGAVLFLCAALQNAFFLRYVFRGRNDCRGRLQTGLCTTWLLGHGLMMLLIAVVYQRSPFALPPTLRYSDRQGTLWWYTQSFIIWTGAGRFALGCIFPLKKKEEKRCERVET
jgi:hypothetical protein